MKTSNNIMKGLLIFILSALVVVCRGELSSTNIDGGSVSTSSGGGKVNAKSSLHRSWIVVNDPACPIQISGNGIQTKSLGDLWIYNAVGSFTPKVDTAGFEIRYALYDLFGNHLGTLSDTEIADWKTGKTIALNGNWTSTHDDVMGLLTVVTFISEARTQDGKIWRYDQQAITEYMDGLHLQGGASLEPKPPAAK